MSLYLVWCEQCTINLNLQEVDLLYAEFINIKGDIVIVLTFISVNCGTIIIIIITGDIKERQKVQ